MDTANNLNFIDIYQPVIKLSKFLKGKKNVVDIAQWLLPILTGLRLNVTSYYATENVGLDIIKLFVEYNLDSLVDYLERRIEFNRKRRLIRYRFEKIAFNENEQTIIKNIFKAMANDIFKELDSNTNRETSPAELSGRKFIGKYFCDSDKEIAPMVIQ